MAGFGFWRRDKAFQVLCENVKGDTSFHLLTADSVNFDVLNDDIVIVQVLLLVVVVVLSLVVDCGVVEGLEDWMVNG